MKSFHHEAYQLINQYCYVTTKLFWKPLHYSIKKWSDNKKNYLLKEELLSRWIS